MDSLYALLHLLCEQAGVKCEAYSIQTDVRTDSTESCSSVSSASTIDDSVVQTNTTRHEEASPVVWLFDQDLTLRKELIRAVHDIIKIIRQYDSAYVLLHKKHRELTRYLPRGCIIALCGSELEAERLRAAIGPIPSPLRRISDSDEPISIDSETNISSTEV
ncbi:hypothetical protein GMRT_10921 [Giardia muris]|uniref:Uncharacterized protein n=1 Tax=Giardia muris TaxID=5742 RepID=A0A4Z1T473_GIAMU|nr:hypothetical protein GMRT_10921 [Giardia muris]|eukprot:TNJ30458.1 hypothetical protein GMRT_10921 [Giardia muris]